MELLSFLSSSRAARKNTPDSREADSSASDEAARRWRRVVELDPTDEEARLRLLEQTQTQGDNAATAAQIAELDEMFPDSKAVRTAVARHFFHAGDNELAFDRWSRLDADYPDQSECLNNLAFLNMRAERFDKALELADRLERDHDAAERAGRIRARVFDAQEDWPSAIAQWRVIHREKPDELDALQHLIGAHWKHGEPEEGLATLDAASPDLQSAESMLYWRARLLERLDRIDEALAVLSEQIDTVSALSAMRLMHANLLYRSGRLDEAEQACVKMIDASPDNIKALTLHARIAQARLSHARVA